MTQPPQSMIDAAIGEATRSPCAKSQRGVVLYRLVQYEGRGGHAYFIGSGHNGPPDDGACDGSAACREFCGRRCVHAEVRAIRAAIWLRGDGVSDLEAIHVKVADGKLAAGGGPSCWQCSREVLDVGLAGFWLYEQVPCRCVAYYATCPECPEASASRPITVHHGCGLHDEGGIIKGAVTGRWARYTAAEFHAATLKACGMPEFKPWRQAE